MSITHFCHINIKSGCKFVTSFLKIIKIKSAERRLQLSLLCSRDALTNNKRSSSLLAKNNTLEIHTDRRTKTKFTEHNGVNNYSLLCLLML